MQVSLNKHSSTSHDLIGGGPQVSLKGQLLYIIGSDNEAEEVATEDKYKYVEDLPYDEGLKYI